MRTLSRRLIARLADLFPEVIWLRGCDYPTDVADGLIRKQAIRITEFLQNEDQGVLILTPQTDSVRTSRGRTSSLD